MAANMPPNGPALLTVGAIAVLLQAWLTSSPTVPPAYQAEMPRKPEAVQDAAAARALRSSVEGSNPAAESMDTAAPGAHQYGTQGWHDVRRARNGAAGTGAAGEGAEGEGADGKGAAHSEAQENEPRSSSGHSSWRAPSPGTQSSPGRTEESGPEEVGEIEPAVFDALAAYRLTAHPEDWRAIRDALRHEALRPALSEQPEQPEQPEHIALDATALEALLQLAGANPSAGSCKEVGPRMMVISWPYRTTRSPWPRFPCADGACCGAVCAAKGARRGRPMNQRLQREHLGPIGPKTTLTNLPSSCTRPARCLHAACTLPARYLHAGANPSKREARGHAATLRALGHTHISAAVLQAALLDFRAAHPPDEERAALEEAWAVVDADADGAVRGGEVHAMLDLILTQGEPLTAEETADFWAEVDTDADGEVTRQGGS